MSKDGENPLDRVHVAINSLRVGVKIKHSITDADANVLAMAGAVYTEAVKSELSERGITSVYVHQDEVKRHESETLPAPRAFDAQRAARFTEELENAATIISEIGDDFSNLTTPQLTLLSEVPLQFSEIVSEDADQAVAMVSDGKSAQDLAHRCVQFCLLAIGTAFELGLQPEQIEHVGVAALLHDLGLFLYPDHFRSGDKPLRPDEIWEYQKHGQTCVDVVNGVTKLPNSINLLISQVHERVDGSGYPRGIDGNLQHKYARILSIADAYLTLTLPGPGRKAIVPHDAMKFMLHQVPKGAFDSETMRAFLCYMSLYPIGSSVELDDGRTAVVFRRSSNDYSVPVLMISEGDAIQYIDIGQDDAKIARPKMDPSGKQIRLDKQTLATSVWDQVVQS